MNSRGVARVGLLVSSLMISGLLISAQDNARLYVSNATVAGSGVTGGSAVAGDRGNHVQSLGCDKPKKPSCNKPGRRSTHR